MAFQRAAAGESAAGTAGVNGLRRAAGKRAAQVIADGGAARKRRGCMSVHHERAAMLLN